MALHSLSTSHLLQAFGSESEHGVVPFHHIVEDRFQKLEQRHDHYNFSGGIQAPANGVRRCLYGFEVLSFLVLSHLRLVSKVIKLGGHRDCWTHTCHSKGVERLGEKEKQSSRKALLELNLDPTLVHNVRLYELDFLVYEKGFRPGKGD